jgi:carbonic anhydrase
MRSFAVLCLAVSASAGSWNYLGQDDWGEHYPGCAGANQSPINLYTGIQGEQTTTGFGPLNIDFSSTAAGSWENNGHTIQISFTGEAGSTTSGGNLPITMMSEDFKLLQLHFHSPSEHVVDGKSYPLEGHFVHQSESGALAVVGVFFTDADEAEPNSQIQVLFEGVPIIGAKRDIESIDLNGILPENARFFSYVGSTTTPPCVANVRWNIFETPVAISTEQLARFNRYYRGNNRNLQEIGDGRFVVLNENAGKAYPTLESEYEFPEYFEPQIPE